MWVECFNLMIYTIQIFILIRHMTSIAWLELGCGLIRITKLRMLYWKKKPQFFYSFQLLGWERLSQFLLSLKLYYTVICSASFSWLRLLPMGSLCLVKGVLCRIQIEGITWASLEDSELCKQYHFIWRTSFGLVCQFTLELSGITDQGQGCHTPAAAESYCKKGRFMSILVILNQGYRSYATESPVALNCRHYAKEKCRRGCWGSPPGAIGHLCKLSEE